MADQNQNLSAISKIDQLIWDFFAKSTDIILQGRRAVVQPVVVSHGDQQDTTQGYADNADYCASNLKPWKRNVACPMILELYVGDISNQQLLERWIFFYQRKDDSKDSRFNLVTTKIVTLLKTLYCFVRLLPGFQFLTVARRVPMITFQLFKPPTLDSLIYPVEASRYDFPVINTSKGILSLTVQYMKPLLVQRLLGLSPINWQSPSQNYVQTASSSSLSIAIPIPGGGQPISRQNSRERERSGSFTHNNNNNTGIGDKAPTTPYSQFQGSQGYHSNANMTTPITIAADQVKRRSNSYHESTSNQSASPGQPLYMRQYNSPGAAAISSSPGQGHSFGRPQSIPISVPVPVPSGKSGSSKSTSNKLTSAGRSVSHTSNERSSPSSFSPSSFIGTPVFSLIDYFTAGSTNTTQPASNINQSDNAFPVKYQPATAATTGNAAAYASVSSSPVTFQLNGLSGLLLVEEASSGDYLYGRMSPQFPNPSSHLYSTSPQVPSSLSSYQSLTLSNAKRLSDRNSGALKLASIDEEDCDLDQMVLPLSPFELFKSKTETLQIQDLPTPDNRKPDLSESDNREELLRSDDDGDDHNNGSDSQDSDKGNNDEDEYMPFAWAQSEQNVSLGIADNRSLAEQCAAPPPLVSYNEYKYQLASQELGQQSPIELANMEMQTLKEFRAMLMNGR